jgi:hypothetical protein
VAWQSHPKPVHSVKTDTSMAWIKKYRSSLHERHTGQELSLAVNPSNTKAPTSLAVNPSRTTQIQKQPSTQKAYWTRTKSRGQPLQGLPKYKSTPTWKAYWTSLVVNQPFKEVLIFKLFRLSFHVVGKGVCLVMLWPNPARRDKPWNYTPLKFQRYTKHILATCNLYGHVGNDWGISFPKRIKQKDHFLGELFQE